MLISIGGAEKLKGEDVEAISISSHTNNRSMGAVIDVGVVSNSVLVARTSSSPITSCLISGPYLAWRLIVSCNSLSLTAAGTVQGICDKHFFARGT